MLVLRAKEISTVFLQNISWRSFSGNDFSAIIHWKYSWHYISFISLNVSKFILNRYFLIYTNMQVCWEKKWRGWFDGIPGISGIRFEESENYNYLSSSKEQSKNYPSTFSSTLNEFFQSKTTLILFSTNSAFSFMALYLKTKNVESTKLTFELDL